MFLVFTIYYLAFNIGVSKIALNGHEKCTILDKMVMIFYGNSSIVLLTSHCGILNFNMAKDEFFKEPLQRSTLKFEIMEIFLREVLLKKIPKGASINYVDKQGGEGVAQTSKMLHKII